MSTHNNVQRQVRHQQRVEQLCAAAIRALSGETDLHFRGQRLYRGRKVLPLFAPHLHPDSDKDDFTTFRGAADGLALRLSLSDAALHRQKAPDEPVAYLIFDLLEQIRVESLADPAMPGVARNLEYSFKQWSLAFLNAQLADSETGILLYTVVQMCRSRVLAKPVPDAIEDFLESTRAGIGPLIGASLAQLRRCRHAQSSYAMHAWVLARQVADMLSAAETDEISSRAQGEDSEDIERAAFSLVMQVGKEVPERVSSISSGRSLVLEEAADVYQVFTHAYDREVHARDLVRASELDDYRQRLDQAVAAQGINLPRLARALKALLAQPTFDGWESAQEEGLIDGRRLTQLIASPTERRLFKRQQQQAQANCVVSLLVDCSGSMREHVQAVSVLVDVLTRALEMAGVVSEVLGFTTGAWSGGRAQRDWQRAGRPAHPGRLNELCHIVFKDAKTSWRQGRSGISAMLKADLFRESVDGEALEWACERLANREEARKLLIVVSDGCPMDGATQLANDAFYLDNHLQQVVLQHEQRGEVLIFALGVGMDLSPYYSRCHALDLASAPLNASLHEIVALLGRRVWR